MSNASVDRWRVTLETAPSGGAVMTDVNDLPAPFDPSTEEVS